MIYLFKIIVSLKENLKFPRGLRLSFQNSDLLNYGYEVCSLCHFVCDVNLALRDEIRNECQYMVHIKGNAHNQNGFNALLSGFKLIASMHVLSILLITILTTFHKHYAFTVCFYLLWESEPVC